MAPTPVNQQLKMMMAIQKSWKRIPMATIVLLLLPRGFSAWALTTWANVVGSTCLTERMLASTSSYLPLAVPMTPP